VVAVERVGAEDWQRVRALRLRTLDDAPDAFWVTAQEEAATSSAEWRRRLLRSDNATFVAHDNGVDVGLAVGAPHYEDEGDAGLYGLWVAPEARGRGVGHALVQSVVMWAGAAGYPCVRLEVGDQNTPAVALYERAGFRPSGRRSAFRAPRDHLTEHERRLEL